jgi:hypothetical protein
MSDTDFLESIAAPDASGGCTPSRPADSTARAADSDELLLLEERRRDAYRVG